MYEGSGENNTGAKLLQNHKNDASLRHAGEGGRKNRAKNANGAGHKDDEKQAYSQRNVVLAIPSRTCLLFAATGAVSGRC
jgi:hypothetical protein